MRAKSNYRLENDLMLTSGENITIAIFSAILKQRILNVNHFWLASTNNN